MEIWKKIKNFEDLYEISSYGRVKNSRGMILKPLKSKQGYLSVILCRNTVRKQYKIHRLVCLEFLENPYNLPEVNHKDEDKQNNKLSNLEWCGRKYNANYGDAKEKNHAPLRKPVIQYDLNGKFINRFSSVMEAEKSGFNTGAISRCANGEYKQTKGFIWRFENNKS